MNRDKKSTLGALTRVYDVLAISESGIHQGEAHICIEDTATLHLNGVPILSLALTPAELDVFALGHLVCEGILEDPGMIDDIAVDGRDIHVRTAGHDRLAGMCATELRSSGCIGVSTSWETLPAPLPDTLSLDLPTIFDAMDTLHRLASTWKHTGGTHCAVILDAEGAVHSHAEDMGRHTAVDKAVGKAIRAGVDLGQCFMVCSGRMPAGMVAKAYRAGISILASNNAPFSTGVDMARRLNMTLVGFARPPRAVVYSAPHRISGL
jgi:FdhD protein